MTTTANESLQRESQTESCETHPYSAISEHSSVKGTPTAIRDWLMSSLLDFHVRTCPSQIEPRPASKANDPGSGLPSKTLFALFDRDLSCWKTVQRSLFADSSELQTTWPRWGTAFGGECWEHITLDSRINANAGGVSLPTPLAEDWKGGTTALRDGKLRTDQFRHYVKIKFGWTYPNPDYSEAVMGWPIEWTALEPLAMGKFQQWCEQHGIC